ncbi:MAG: long-chain-fatty-acid--CoA ligase [Solirubrobacteraceae bacterium]|nr:long-chain-fatty-acid--CoA ligase [Solirubrobacteraceae bacterium]
MPTNAVSPTPLTPLRFLERSATVHPQRTAIVHGQRRITYSDMAAESTRLAHALRASGIEPGDRVAYLCPNIPEELIAHFAVPLAGAVLVALNTRLAPDEIRHILDHCGAKLLVVDRELATAVAPIASSLATVTDIVIVDDDQAPAQPDAAGDTTLEGLSYADLLARGSDEPLPWEAQDELDTISINYTSGTTGQPKGVMYTHRGAYLNALGEVLHSEHTAASVYLWTLPMFHCNGWCTTWGVTAVAGRHVCLRAVRGDAMWALIRQEGVTHLNGAPVVLSTLAAADEAAPLEQPLTITTAGAAPSPTTIGQLEAIGARIIHMYGLTETYGPYSVCDWQDGWPQLAAEERATLLARQGVGMVIGDRMRVVDADMNDVPADGVTVGELVMRGNVVMKGYYNDEAATEKAFAGGWFHSGDLGVLQPDGYAKLVDRAKDIVISGGENISTVEVESALMAHPAIVDVAVIGIPHDKWGETPKAFVVLAPDQTADEAEVIAFVRERIAHYKAPRAVEFMEALPRTSTGKVQKFELREREWAGQEHRIKG